MNRISLHNLAWVLSQLAFQAEKVNQISVPANVANDSLLALNRMFELS
jgi:quinolinate synthase